MPIERLPARLRPPLERLRCILMTDAGVMWILGVAMIVRGVSYFDLGSVVLFHPVDRFFPIWVDAAMWIGVGSTLLVASRWHATRFGRMTLAASTGLIAMWGLLFLFSPPAQFAQRGVMYLAIAAIVIWSIWRGKRGEIRVREGAADGATS
ncbi:hypothetical protein NYP18_09285 [Corynebacterium sp. YIM 101645]|uniref:Integral membrane protein n=1 Tax=Corynebacterium lemuris TaxID=1859292 RepID=A0ABT2FX74_9CORY|nr:hypothetical protein [Corynebacterium lemuris]MCS5479852.1 hypothetical protein [Corynebacterium lemuris]